jgi:hypothetical protein
VYSGAGVEVGAELDVFELLRHGDNIGRRGRGAGYLQDKIFFSARWDSDGLFGCATVLNGRNNTSIMHRFDQQKMNSRG